MPSNTELYQNAFAFRHTINFYKEREEQRNHMFAITHMITYKVKPKLSSRFTLPWYCCYIILTQPRARANSHDWQNVKMSI